MSTPTSIIQRIAKATDCNHYSVIGARVGSVVSLVAFAALAILWGNLSDISNVTRMGLGIGALGAVTLLGGFEVIAEYWKRGEIFRQHREIRYYNGDSYTGDTLSTGKRDGNGVYRFANGNQLIGRFENDSPVAKETVLHLPNKSTYQGEYNESGQPHGSGTLKLPNRDCIEGMFDNGQPQHGTWFFSNNEHYKSYSGLIQQDAQGTFTRLNGSIVAGRLLIYTRNSSSQGIDRNPE